jgi:hypothetical protein
MKTKKLKTILSLAGVPFLLLCLGAVPLQADDIDLERLVRQLGADKFAERQQAERELKTLSREPLNSLRKMLSASDDPEIRLRLEGIIEHLVSDTSKIPKAYRVLKAMERGALAPLAEDFRGRASVAASNTGGSSGTSGAFAQSFIPKCKTVSSIEVCTYALTDAFGWMRLDLCEDKNGAPGFVLARSWVRIPKKHNFPHGEYVCHNIPDQSVNPASTYWLVYSEFPDQGSKDSMINYGLSFHKDDYPDGMLWRGSGDRPKQDEDVKFRIFSSSPESHQGYRKASELERKTVPSENQKRIWHQRKS